MFRCLRNALHRLVHRHNSVESLNNLDAPPTPQRGGQSGIWVRNMSVAPATIESGEGLFAPPPPNYEQLFEPARPTPLNNLRPQAIDQHWLGDEEPNVGYYSTLVEAICKENIDELLTFIFSPKHCFALRGVEVLVRGCLRSDSSACQAMMRKHVAMARLALTYDFARGANIPIYSEDFKTLFAVHFWRIFNNTAIQLEMSMFCSPHLVRR